ncbi:MAG: hypothetical protein KOO61_05295 [Spirochaetales bacterium]|nr:hypothetical protein [Spirochaetales bacterium]
MDITVTVEDVELQAVLNDSPIAAALVNDLPAVVRMSRWGDEYYGSIGLGMDNDRETREDVEVGTLAYWPTGDALCIFFGPTPVSTGPLPRAASAVSVIGSVTGGDLDALRQLGSSVSVRISLG